MTRRSSSAFEICVLYVISCSRRSSFAFASCAVAARALLASCSLTISRAIALDLAMSSRICFACAIQGSTSVAVS